MTVAGRLESLFRLGASVLAAASERDVLAAIVEQAAGLAGASMAVVGLIEGGSVRVAAEYGYPPGHLDEWRLFPIAPGLPMTDVIASAQPVYCSSRGERDRRWPLFHGLGDSEAFVVLPLAGRDGVVGALTLSYLEERAFDLEERAFLEAFSAQCALALERARALAAEQRRSSELSFRAEASRLLAGSLDYQETLEQVGRLIVPGLADWFACDLRFGDAVEPVAISHVDPEKVRWARELRVAAPIDLDAPTGLPHVLRSGSSELIEEVNDELIEAAARSADELALIRRLQLSSVMIVPLIAREQVLGALTFVWAESGRHYDKEDLSLAEELATRAAVAIDNARLYGEQLAAHAAEKRARERTERLQRFSTRLAPALTIDAVAEIAVDKALVASGASTALLALESEHGQTIEIRRIDGRLSPEMTTRRAFPRDHASAVAAVFRNQEPLWLRNRAEWERYPESIGRPGFLQSAAVLPVAAATQFFGVLGIAFADEREFAEDERRFLQAIASQTALALDRAALHEEQHHIAEVLQQSLLPQTLPTIPGIALAASYRAAGSSNQAGGDFYDIFETAKGHILVVGDVCGHGPEAAALTALCRYSLRACTLQNQNVSPAELVDLLNRAILEHGPRASAFASATCALLQLGRGEVSVTLSSAGHPPTVIRRNGGTIETYAPNGPLAGLFAGAAYPEQDLELHVGDLMLLHTDGLTDARDQTGQRLGDDPVHQTLASLADGADPQDATRALEHLLEGLEVTDDIAILTVTITGTP